MTRISLLAYIPGFGGGGSPAPPPPPAAPPRAPRRTDAAVQTARAHELKRSKLAAGHAGTNKTGGVLTDDASMANKTLLG